MGEVHQLLLLVKEPEQNIPPMISSYVSNTLIFIFSRKIIPGDAAASPLDWSRKASVPLCSKGKQTTRPFRAGWRGSETPPHLNYEKQKQEPPALSLNYL